jgi:hypothetical protein
MTARGQSPALPRPARLRHPAPMDARRRVDPTDRSASPDAALITARAKRDG